MKRNLVAVGALVIAIALSSFTKKTIDVYLVYKSTATVEKNFSSFDQQSTSPGTISNTNSPARLAWAKFVDDDGIVESGEFSTEFEVLDVTDSGSNLLSDETEDHTKIELQ